MTRYVNITVRCPYIDGYPRSISYCRKCDSMKGIDNDILICDKEN